MIDEKELKSYIERLHNEHHGGKGDWHFRLALRKVLYFIDAMNKHGVTSMDVIKTKRMKTIDEFATEYSQDKYLPVQTSQAIKAGANHVLEEIEKVVQGDLDSHSAFKLKCIKQIVEQLKK